jgi:3-oxoacyl-[acyl-carrier protein] reductase
MIVTGASSGLGEALTLRFAADGMKVCAVARSRDKLKQLAERYPDNIDVYPTDVSDAKQVKMSFAAILEKYPAIDVLINNASVLNHAKFGEVDFEIIDRVIDTNLKGTMYCTYAVLPSMMDCKAGRIINIASVAGLPGGRLPAPPGVVSFGDYHASKFGVVGFGDMIAQGLLQYGIHVITLCPGGINTPLWEKNGVNVYPGDPNELIQPEEIGDLIAFLLEQPNSTLYKQLFFFPTNEWH